MDWTIGPLDYWIIFELFFGPFLDQSFGPIFFWTIYRGEVDHKYLGTGGMQPISTQGGV